MSFYYQVTAFFLPLSAQQKRHPRVRCSRPSAQHNLRIRRCRCDTKLPGKHDLLLFIEQLALQSFRDANFVLADDLGKDAETLRKSKTLSDANVCSP